MIDYEKFSREEMDTICGWITEKPFKDYFQRNTREFNRLKPGFRPQSLKRSHICEIVYKHRTDAFIASFLNDCIGQLLSTAKAIQQEKTDSGSDEETALTETLADSPFAGHIPLYFKLLGESHSDEYIRMTAAAVAMAAKQRESAADEAPSDSGQADSQQELSVLKAEMERMQASAEQDQHTISEQEHQITELRAFQEQTEAQLEEYRKRDEMLRQKRYVPVSDYTHPDFPFTSLCRVENGVFKNAPYMIIRLADVKDGLLIPFEKDTGAPPTFSNRDYLYKNDGPDELSFYGIWNWRADTQPDNPEKDRIVSHYNPDCLPIEIVESGCNDLKALADSLLKGIFAKKIYGELFWCYRTQEGYLGLLIDRKQYQSDGKHLTLSEAVHELPVYQFSEAEVLSFDSGRIWFLRRLNPGVPCPVRGRHYPDLLVPEKCCQHLYRKRSGKDQV